MATHDVTLIGLNPDRNIHLEKGKIVSDADGKPPKSETKKASSYSVIPAKAGIHKINSTETKRKIKSS